MYDMEVGGISEPILAMRFGKAARHPAMAEDHLG